MRLLLQRSLLLVLLLMGLRSVPAAASHLLGGEITYSYLNANGPAATPYRYRITVLLYVNAGSSSQVPEGRPSIDVAFYNKTNGARLQTITIQRTTNPIITPPQPGGCSTPGTAVSVRLVRYETIVNLPLSFDGYYAVYTDGTRNAGILNLNQSDSWSQLIYVEMAPPLLPNSSPTFSDTAVVVVCQGDTSIIVNNAVDADGDRLIYSFSRPYGVQNAQIPPPLPATFTPPPSAVAYAPGYSQALPFGTGPNRYAFLNASNGLSAYSTALLGSYVVAVEVKEYRTINNVEVLIGSTRREIQLVSRTCTPNRPPQFTAATTATHLYTIEEGQTVGFNLASTDPDGNAINLKVNSVLLDGSGPFNASFAGSQGTVQPGNPTGTVTVNGSGGSVNGQFVFNSSCGTARATPYDVVVTATDVTCGAKSIADVFQIQVTKAAGPTSVSGADVICDRAQVSTYTVGGPAASSYRWRAYGGAIQGSNSGSTVQVLWNSTGAGRIMVQGISTLGCPSDSVSRVVDVRPASGLAVTPASAAICVGASTTLTASGGQNYVWTGGSQPVSGATITVSPTQTTTYTVTATDGICTTTRQVTVVVNLVAVAQAGADVSVCSDKPVQLGAAAVAGYTYQWSPPTGLSSATVANPIFTRTNATTGPQQLTYTLTATTAQGCVATDNVIITLNEAAVAQAGTDQTICSGGSAAIGVANPGVTVGAYLWTPATGLANPNSPNTTVTLTNTGSIPVTTEYVLLATTAAGCTITDTVRVTVNPAAVADAGTDRAVCSGDNTTLGSAALAGYTYQWSPAAGLSSATAAQPVFSQPNLGTTPQLYTFAVTATTAQGCTSTATVRVTVNPAAVADAGPDRVICSAGTATLGNAASAVAGNTYLWTPATGLSNPNVLNPTITLTNTGTIPTVTNYTLLVTTNLGCPKTDLVQVTVNPAAIAQAGTDRAICSGETTPLGATALTGYTYLWSPATNLSSATASNPTFTQVNTGTTPQLYTFVVTATTAEGCTATATVRVTVNPAAVANAGTDLARCAGATATLGTAVLTGYTYQWSPATNLSSATAAQPVFTAVNTTQAPITTTYTVTATTAQGCVSTDAVTVTVNPTPLSDNVQGSQSVCPTVQGIAYSVVNPRSSTYQWTVVGGTVVSGQGTPSITVNWNGANANASVQATAVNATLCQSPAFTLPVRVNQLLQTARPAGQDNVCQANGPYTYQTTPTAGSIYAWTIVGGTQVASSANTVTVQWTRPGIGKIAVFETTDPSGGRCISQTPLDTLYVNVLPSPSALLAIAGPRRACVAGGNLSFSLPGAATSTYAYTLDGAALPGTTGTITLPTPTTPGTYTLTAVEKNTSLCAGPTYSTQFVVVPALAVAGPANYCPGSSTELTYTVGATASALPNANYQWTVTGGTVVSGQGTGTVTVSFPAGTTAATLQVSDVNSAGCAATFTVRPDNASVALQAASVVAGDRGVALQLNVPNNAGNGNQVTITRRDAGTTNAYVIVGSVANTATTFTDASVDADAKAYDYRIELRNGCGTLLQSREHTTIRTVAQATEGQAGRDQGKVAVSWNAYRGFDVKEYQVFRTADTGPAQLVATVPGTTLQTEFSGGAAGFDQCVRVVAVSTTGASLTSSSNEACVTFTNDLQFFNVMTPNGDGLNDKFEVKNLSLYPGSSLTILNRWGKEVYTATNYNNAWGGEEQSAGVYYYLLKLAGGKSYKGWFEIVK